MKDLKSKVIDLGEDAKLLVIELAQPERLEEISQELSGVLRTAGVFGRLPVLYIPNIDMVKILGEPDLASIGLITIESIISKLGKERVMELDILPEGFFKTEATLYPPEETEPIEKKYIVFRGQRHSAEELIDKYGVDERECHVLWADEYYAMKDGAKLLGGLPVTEYKVLRERLDEDYSIPTHTGL